MPAAPEPVDPAWHPTACDPGQRCPPGVRYWWDNRNRQPVGDVVVQYTISGRVWLRRGAASLTADPGQAILFVYGEDSAYGLTRSATETYVCAWVSLRGAGLAEHWRWLIDRHGAVVAMPAPALASLHRLAAAMQPTSRSSPRTLTAATHALVLALDDGLDQVRSEGLTPVDRAIEAITADPARPWSLKEVAAAHGCSREHLTRAFSRRHGVSPGVWLARARLAVAADLIRHSGLSLAAVAAQSGLGSAHTLARRIRAATGAAPSALRRGQPL